MNGIMKPRLLILDTEAVIHLCEIGKWDALLEAYEVVLPETVAMKECRYYEDDSGYRIEISITEDIDSGRIRMESASFAEVNAILQRLGRYSTLITSCILVNWKQWLLWKGNLWVGDLYGRHCCGELV